MNRTITVDDRSYTIAPMKFRQAREIFRPDAEVFGANCAMVAACLNNASVAPASGAGPSAASGQAPDAGATFWTAEDVLDLPYLDGQTLVLACMEMNGLKAASGEAQPQPAKTGPAGDPDLAAQA
jgi:hypothetical protein